LVAQRFCHAAKIRYKHGRNKARAAYLRHGEETIETKNRNCDKGAAAHKYSHLLPVTV
jgi:hypothetical protein